MNRPQFFKELSKRTGVSKETIQQIVEAEENLIYEIMATCDSFRYVWGTISGIEKPPKRVAGMYRELKVVKDRGGWSNWKKGYPKVKWSKVAKVCENFPPQDYFEQPEVRYTSEARFYRKDVGLPEIPEFEGLTEEKIEEICKKADQVELEKLTAKQRWNKERDKKFNDQKKLAMIDYWKKTNYIPQGCLYIESLGDQNYTGKQRDTIDYYLETRLTDDKDIAEKLEVILTAQDVAEYKNMTKDHPELQEMREKFEAELEAKHLPRIPHVKKDYDDKDFTLKYKGDEDPWGIMKNAAEERKKRISEAKEDFEKSLEENEIIIKEEV